MTAADRIGLRDRILLTCFGIGAAALIGSTLWMVAQHRLTAPFQDQWDMLAWFHECARDCWSPSLWWRQHNEHRLAVPRLFFLADVHLFGGTNLLLVCANLAIQTFHGIVLAWLALRDPVIDRRAGLTFAIAAWATVLSGGQLENFIWGFQVQIVLVLLLATLASLALVRNRPLVAGILATLATYTMANGVILWIVLVLLALGRRMPLKIVGALVFAGIPGLFNAR